MIRLIIPDIKFSDVAKNFQKILNSGRLTQGEYVKKFEKAVAEFVGTKYAFATTSATTALHLSLVALGIKKGDEVLVSDFTFPATANVVVQVGARPVLVDIRLDSFNIDLNDLKKKITKKTKAIIPVDAFGRPVDMPSIMSIAKKHKLFVIEDAACAIGASFDRKKTGSLGTVGCFSFHPRKSITTGEGGMITTNDEKVAKNILILRNHGGILQKSKRYYQYVMAGFNYRMSEIQAAMGLQQMKKINNLISQRIKIASRMTQKIQQISNLRPPLELLNEKNVFQSYVTLVSEDINRDLVIKKMRKKGIETTLGTYALHAQPFFIKHYHYKPGQLKNSYKAFLKTLTLPLYNTMTAQQIKYITNNLREILTIK